MTGLNLRESITVQCNHDDKVKTFINKIRRIEGVVVESIDYHNPDRGMGLFFSNRYLDGLSDISIARLMIIWGQCDSRIL